MRQLSIPGLALGLALLSSPAAFAATGDAAFDRLDTDGSGTISRAEFLDLRKRMFAAIDADHSGTLTRAEIDAARAAQGDKAPRADDRIWAQDTNNDGQLTLAEFTARLRGFDLADRNGDGQLDRAEFDRIARFVAQARN